MDVTCPSKPSLFILGLEPISVDAEMAGNLLALLRTQSSCLLPTKHVFPWTAEYSPGAGCFVSLWTGSKIISELHVASGDPFLSFICSEGSDSEVSGKLEEIKLFLMCQRQRWASGWPTSQIPAFPLWPSSRNAKRIPMPPRYKSQVTVFLSWGSVGVGMGKG